VRPEVLGKLEKIHLIGTRSRDLPACSIVPYPLRYRLPPLTDLIMVYILYSNIWRSLLFAMVLQNILILISIFYIIYIILYIISRGQVRIVGPAQNDRKNT
jgi:hypothetical protein